MSTVSHELLALSIGYLDGLNSPLVEGFLPELRAGLPSRRVTPSSLPCLAVLPRAAAIAPGRAAPLAGALARAAGALAWGQTYRESDLGRDFLDRYGWTELAGTRGPFASERIAAGFLLLGPGTHYPDHHHLAEEIYVPLTGGAEWRKGDGPFAARAAGEVIHHPSNVSHAMRAGAEPLLALYLWRGGPLAQKSTVTGKARA